MNLAGIYCDPRIQTEVRDRRFEMNDIAWRAQESVEEVFAGEYNDYDFEGAPTEKQGLKACHCDVVEEEMTTVASLQSTDRSSGSSTIGIRRAAAPEGTKVLPEVEQGASYDSSSHPPRADTAISILALSRALWRLCRQRLHLNETEMLDHADLRAIFDWVLSLQRREEARREIEHDKLADAVHIERLIASALVIVQRAHQQQQNGGKFTPLSIPGVASSTIKDDSTKFTPTCCSARRAFSWRGSGKFPDPLGLSSLVSRATHKAVELLSSGFDEENNSSSTSSPRSAAAVVPSSSPFLGLQDSDVKFRDCSAVLQVIVSFCHALVAGGVWVDEAAPLSTSTITEFLMDAANALRRARICTPVAANQQVPNNANPLWIGAARFKQRLSSNFRPLRAAPPPCSLCVTMMCINPLSELYTFEQSLCQFLSFLNYETRICDSDVLRVYF